MEAVYILRVSEQRQCTSGRVGLHQTGKIEAVKLLFFNAGGLMAAAGCR